MRTKKEIYKSCQSDLLKRVFSIKGEGSVVKLEVAEKALRRALDEVFENDDKDDSNIDTHN